MIRSNWIAQQHGLAAVLYVVRGYCERESFHKMEAILNLSQRFSRSKTLYKWRMVARFSSYNAGLVFDLEKRLHQQFSGLSYRPATDFVCKIGCYLEVTGLLTVLPNGTFFLKMLTLLFSF